MSLDNVTAGKNIPESFNVIIEIPMNADPVKYEVDKSTGAIFVDRFMSTSMHYPTNYGYVPKTIAGDGDPVDVLAGEVPVFWACGVTPQAALLAAKPALCITHAPGCMLVTDRSNGEYAAL